MECSTWNISIKIVYILVNHIVVIKAAINHLMKYIKISLNLLLKNMKTMFICNIYYINITFDCTKFQNIKNYSEI